MQSAFLDGGGDVKLVMFDADERYDGHAIFRHANGRGKWLPQMDAFLRFHKLPTWTRDDVNALLKKLNAKETSRGFVENYMAGPSEKALARQKSGGRADELHLRRQLGGKRPQAGGRAMREARPALRGADAQRRLGRLRPNSCWPGRRAIAGRVQFATCLQ